MERWAGRVAVVTGASAGCGAKISEFLVKNGMKVIGCSRNISAIETLSKDLQNEKGRLEAMTCDVRKESDVVAMFKKIRQDHGRVDVCINNAGLAHPAPLLSGETDQWRNMIEVNVLGLATCTREAFKAMKESGVDDGHIININSVAGHRVLGAPNGNFYAATKFAVTALTEGTRCELRQLKSKIRISQISPGLTATEFRGRMMGIDAEATKDLYSKSPCLVPEDVAEAVKHALSAPQHVQVHDIILRHVDVGPD